MVRDAALDRGRMGDAVGMILEGLANVTNIRAKAGRRQQLETEVLAKDGRRWVSKDSIETPEAGNGFMWMNARQLRGMRRGEVQYEPWVAARE